jgi:predicted DNA-binding transcriptional regulator AlpA
METLNPSDLITPDTLAKRLKVRKSWIFEKTRKRARSRDTRPLPTIRLGRYIRFDWNAVSQWMTEQQKGK